MGNKQERSRHSRIYLCYIPNWRELLFVISLGQVQKPLYSNIQLACAFFCIFILIYMIMKSILVIIVFMIMDIILLKHLQ